MKHGRKPTKRQKMAIRDVKLNPDNWLVYKVLTKESALEIIHRETGSKRKIPA